MSTGKCVQCGSESERPERWRSNRTLRCATCREASGRKPVIKLSPMQRAECGASELPIDELTVKYGISRQSVARFRAEFKGMPWVTRGTPEQRVEARMARLFAKREARRALPRTCTRCEETKSGLEFPGPGTGRRRTTCLACKDTLTDPEKRAEWMKIRNRRGALKYSYGLTEAEYEAMLAAQEGRCAICGAEPGKRRLAIDHCHTAGHVRALLCGGCNAGIGHFKESKDAMLKAIEYLDRHGKR